MAPSTKNLRQLLEYKSKNERLEMFDGQGRLVLTVTNYLLKLCSEDDKIIRSLERLDDSAELCWGYNRHTEEDRNFSIFFKSFMADLKEFFRVPKSNTTTYPNELVAVFIDLLLEILEEILRLQPQFIVRFKGPIKTLKTELKFLLTFLGDTPSQSTELETTKNVLTEIEDVVNNVGDFLYSFFFTTDRVSVSGMNRALPDLLKNLKLVEESIKQYCIMASWNIPPGGVTQKPAVVSLFLVDSLLDDLKDLTNHYDNGIADVKDQIVTIHEELTFLRTFLADMQVKSHHELEEFLAQIRDLAYEVEYIVNSFAPPWYLSIRLPQVLEKVKLVRTQLQERKSKYDSALQRVAQYPSQQAPLQYPLVGEEIFVGLEDEVAKIREQLVHGTEHLQIISVFGMPGLGKTTLAKKLYNDPFVLYHFDRRSWCAVSQTYERRNILTDILTSMYELDREAIMDMEDDTLGLKLYQRLKGRRYFIVMDDIWNVNAWDDMKRYFPDDRNGSRILFTTRLENVGSNASNRAFVHHLRFLTFEESWTLLQGKVFHKQPCPPDLVETGMKIAEDCDGLPLAVVVIAAVLANLEKKKSVWKEVARSVSSHMTKGQHEYQNILELSYNNLPMHLKPCFLYFGVFEEDKEIPVRKLILLWIAEGFIEKRSYRSSEDVAHEYLAELINRGLVLVSKRRSDGGVKACNIHDLLRDMCLRIGEKDKFMKSIQHQISIYEQHHRLSIHTRSNPSFSRPFGLHVRSVLGNLPDPSEFIISNLKLLKILDLSAMDLRMHNLTRNEVLVLLKFLSVSSIPSSLDIFENLEFLFVDNKDVVEIPDILLNIVKLKHMHFSGGAKFSDSLRERVAEDENCQMNNLENVSSVYLYDENDEKILKCSPHLKRLKCRFTAFWDSSENNYRYAALDFLHKLESLSIAFRPSYISDDDISPDLTSLPRNLRKLTLHNFELSRNQMRIIGKLLKLEVLKLRDNTFEDKLWCTSEDEFQELRFLELDGVQIEHWVASSDDFPKLECLVLRSCQHFEIPFNFADNLSLLKIEVHGCVNSIENSALAIQEEQKNMGNEEFKVIISRSQQ